MAASQNTIREDELFHVDCEAESPESWSYEVLMEEDGNKVLLFAQHRPDICVLTMMLPNKDGFTIAWKRCQVDQDVPDYLTSLPKLKTRGPGEELQRAAMIISASHSVWKN